MKKLLLLLLLVSQVCGAATRVAFFQLRDANGTLVQLEPGGQFFHAALQLEDGRWIHSHPSNGVEIVNELERIGPRAVILADENAPSVSVAQAAEYLGLPFDFKYVWDDSHSSYCAKLIARLLNIQPQPMTFSGPFWNGRQPRERGLGLSPDDIYQILKSRDFAQTFWIQPCERTLTSPTLASLLQAK